MVLCHNDAVDDKLKLEMASKTVNPSLLSLFSAVMGYH